MNNTLPPSPQRLKPACAWRWSALAALLAGGLALQAQQTATIQTRTKNYWTGARETTGTLITALGTHFVGVVGGNSNISFALTTNNPNLVLDPTNLTSITFSPTTLSNSSNLGLRFTTMGPLVPGSYPLLINAYTNDGVSTNLITSTSDLNLLVGRQWSNVTANAIGNWSDTNQWIGGVTPTSADSVYIESSTATTWTNVVDTSFNIQDLIYLRGNVDFTSVTRIAPGATLSVLGPKGFITGSKQANARTTTTRIEGDTLVVSNEAAIFSLTEAMANNTTAGSVNMSGLNNLHVTVDRVGIYDASMLANSTVGVQLRNGFMFAQTNIIKALHTDDYTAQDFNTAIQISRNIAAGNAAGYGSTYAGLGVSNVIFADSLGVGRGGAIGTSVGMGNAFGYPLRFQTQDSAAPTSSATFRNTDGVSRMSLVAVGVDSGTNSVNNNAGVINLRGGKVDMLVDEIWVGRLRNNNGSANYYCAGGFYFDNGVVDANLVRLGYGQYTNVIDAAAPQRGMIGYLLVGTNGTFVVNDELNLGYTPADVTGFENYVAVYGGQIRLDNGGRIHANRITLGEHGTNSLITINNGGALVVSNTVASASKFLPRLTANGGSITLHPNGGTPLVYVSNLVATASTKINIGGFSGLGDFPFGITSTNIPLIKYETATAPGFWAGGTAPAGIVVAIVNDTVNKTINAILIAGEPKTLVWRDYTGDHTWNTTSKNWLDVNTGLQTNFNFLDAVTFDDNGHPQVTVSGLIIPNQNASGTVVTNSSVNYVLTGSGQLAGASVLIKQGSGSLVINLPTEYAVTLSEGSMTNTAQGVLNSVNVSSTATFLNGGVMSAALDCSGLGINANSIVTGVTVRNAGYVLNSASGLINGSVTIANTGGSLVNDGTITVSTATVNAGGILYNTNTINATTINVNSGGTLVDAVPGSVGNASGSINVGTGLLNVNSGGTFIPGDGNIQMTKVVEYPKNSALPSGGLRLAQGGIIHFKLNTDSVDNNQVLVSQAQFGPSPGSTGLPRAFNGCTIVITNVGAAPFAAGQIFGLFRDYIAGGDLYANGLTTSTNSFPVIQPATPGPGLKWSWGELYFKGNLKVVSEDDPAYAVNLAATLADVGGTNFLTMTWPASAAGGWLEYTVIGLTNGLSETNVWTYFQGSSTNLEAVFQIPSGEGGRFFRFVYP